MSSTTMKDTRAGWDWNVWFQWILANAVGETVGLGGTLVIGGLLLLKAQATMGVVPAAVLAVLAGTFIEGTVVGTAQWLVLHRPIKDIRWCVWVLATAIGAFVAWTLGMIPSTFMFAGADSGGTASTQMSDLVIYTLAAVMGFVLGPILGVPQWLVLRRYLPKAGWWVLANALAWMVGMVIVFVATNFIPPEGITLNVAFVLLLFLFIAGAAVGAIHGLVLIWLLHLRSQARSEVSKL
ncbi:MAG TPA: hypothetical protein VN954_00695 [Ktedonobacteraceae bacterium]|nr:hypothetical protein [Ktedonobacteraceae bacterium]